MKNSDQDNLKALFERFMSSADAQQAAEAIQSGDEILRTHPAPEPDDEMILGLKLQIATRLSSRRHRVRVHRLYRLLAGIAAVIVLALIVFNSQPSPEDGSLSHAALIPSFIWDSEDIPSDDMELAYFNAEIDQIEAQIRALEAGESQDAGAHAIDEVEMELVRVSAAFWKE